MNTFNKLSNNNDISNSILSPSTTSFSNSSISSTTSGISNESSFFDTIKNISATTWIIIVLILAILGFNIFTYLAKGTQDVSGFLRPIIEKAGQIFANVTGQIVDVSAEGTKAVVSGTAATVNTTATTINKGLTELQEITPEPKTSSTNMKSQSVQNTIPEPDIMRENTLNKALNTSAQTNAAANDYQADDSSSTIQSGPSKAGWCFIGEDRGFRTCAQVSENDTCMSGKIFPSQEICINPSLRA